MWEGLISGVWRLGAAMYGAAIAIQGKMHNISLYVRCYFLQPATRWNVIRCVCPAPPPPSPPWISKETRVRL